jgi:Asp/Glu/hydantoin racemase
LIVKDLFLQKVEEKIRRTTIRRSWGQAIGILLLDSLYPRIPGDFGNATTYPFPVRFQIVKGLRLKDIMCEKPDISVCQRYIEGAKELEREGVRAIALGCGYLIYFQDEIAGAVNVPVFSSLIQVPLVAKMLGKNKRVGIICADSRYLTETHLKKAGIDDSMQVAVVGMNWNWSIVRAQDPKKRLYEFERALSKVAKKLVSKHPDIGALVFECSNFPPAAAAVQEATGLPVFDFVTLIYMIHGAVVRKRYSGYM